MTQLSVQQAIDLAMRELQAGRLEAAVAAFGAVLALDPRNFDAQHHLGHVLNRLNRFADAVAAYRAAIVLNPASAPAHIDLGNLLCELGELDAAAAEHRQALRLYPNCAEAYNGLANVAKERGAIGEAIACYRKASALAPEVAIPHSSLVYTLQFDPACDPATILKEHQLWNQRHAAPLKSSITPHANRRDPGRRLRIGYVSPDFREHPVCRFILPLMENHDRTQFEVFCYASVGYPDHATEQVRAKADVWRDITMLSDADAAGRIREDQIDILIDLSVHSGSNRLLVFARKPAPVQVTYLAYPGTTGIDTMDYRLTDPHLDPPGDALRFDWYSERSIHLSESYWCYRRPVEDAPVGPLAAQSAGQVTFGCLNNPCKVDQSALQTWAELLRAVPNSRLILHAHGGSHQQRYRDVLTKLGIDAGRLSFVPYLPLRDYLAVYRNIDIALDSFPYTGATVSCDALWMGVPVVTLAGKSAVQRAGVSILTNVGLPELIADSPSCYVSIAAELAGDLPRLVGLHSTLRQRMETSPVMDAPRFTRNFEAALRAMWQRWCARASDAGGASA